MDKTASPDALVGQLLDGRYVVNDRIARGGMATVYEATDLRLDRRVALKVMPEALADDDTFTQRFVREARAAARLTHPNVVAVYDQGEDNGLLFLAMEFVPGRHTLRDVIRSEAPLPPARALSIVEEILKALAAAHDAGIVHRDVKPENVLIDPRGQIKVADFGLARAISSATAATATGGVLMGTVSYLPPELVTDGSADARSDVYALGVLLYELLTGAKPHLGESPIQIAYKHVHDDVPPPSAVTPGIPPYLDALVARATSRERDLRPADAHVMLQQVRRVRQALDSGVIDDQELTDDLTPTRPVVVVPEGFDAAAETVVGVGVASSVGEAYDDVFDVSAFDDFSSSSPDERTLMVGEPAPPSPAAVAEPAGPTARDFGPPMRNNVPPVPPPHQSSRRRGWIAFALVLLLAAGAALAGWWFAVGRFQPTPDVVDLSQTAAQQKVEEAGLSFEIEQTAYSETIDPGHVISTEPEPGDDVLKDGTVAAVVSKGPERHDVPKLDGTSESEAIDAINEASLTVGKTTREWSEKLAVGKVISYSPKAGTELRRDAAVALVISKGPKPIKISNHEGDSADSATSELEAAGFDVKRKERYSEDVDQNDVIAQRPGKGTGFKGDVITLVVSKGPPLAEVPGVTGAGVDAATEKLEDAGFKVRVVEADLYIGLGYIVKQDPEGGTMAPIGSTITLSKV